MGTYDYLSMVELLGHLPKQESLPVDVKRNFRLVDEHDIAVVRLGCRIRHANNLSFSSG
jgi:hypothetical protein